MVLSFESGIFKGHPPQMVRTLADLQSAFADQRAAKVADGNQVVYEVHGGPADTEGPARLLYATTILYPGDVGGEYFMTRGHFHTDPSRGELMFTLSGEGALILMDRDRECWSEPMSKGSVHDVDGRHAHRVANTGDAPLVFLVAWMSDCGHDYATTRTNGFSKIMVNGNAGPQLVAR